MFMECCCYKKIITLKFHQLKFSTILLWSQKREKKIKLITNPKKFPTMKVISIRFLEKRKERERDQICTYMVGHSMDHDVFHQKLCWSLKGDPKGNFKPEMLNRTNLMFGDQSGKRCKHQGTLEIIFSNNTRIRVSNSH